MAVSGTHTITGHTNLGASQLNSAAREVYYIKSSIDALLQRCKFYYVAEDSTPALGNRRQGPSRGCAWSSRARDGIRLWQRRAGRLHPEFFRAVPRAVSLRQRDTHEQR